MFGEARYTQKYSARMRKAAIVVDPSNGDKGSNGL